MAKDVTLNGMSVSTIKEQIDNLKTTYYTLLDDIRSGKVSRAEASDTLKDLLAQRKELADVVLNTKESLEKDVNSLNKDLGELTTYAKSMSKEVARRNRERKSSEEQKAQEIDEMISMLAIASLSKYTFCECGDYDGRPSMFCSSANKSLVGFDLFPQGDAQKEYIKGRFVANIGKPESSMEATTVAQLSKETETVSFKNMLTEIFNRTIQQMANPKIKTVEKQQIISKLNGITDFIMGTEDSPSMLERLERASITLDTEQVEAYAGSIFRIREHMDAVSVGERPRFSKLAKR